MELKFIIAIFLLAISSSCYCRFHFRRHNVDDNKRSISKRLLNATQISIEKAPYMAVVEADKSFQYSFPFATAVIISNLFLLSTSEFFTLQQGKNMRAYIGLTNINLAKPQDTYEVENVTHNFGKNGSYSNGIALIRLKREIAFNYRHRPIALMSNNEVIFEQMAEFMILGYGYSGENRKQKSLGILSRKTKWLNTRNVELSNRFFSILMNPQMCPGDHGDPLIIKNKLVGFAIYTDGCDKNDNPVVTFIGIKHFYKWIKQEVGRTNFTEAIRRAYPKKSSNLVIL